MEASLASKWLGLLKEIAPRVARVAFLFNPATAPFAEYYLNPFKAAALSLAVEAIAAPVHDTSSLESVIAAQAREPSGGLIVMPETFLNVHRAEVTSLAARYRCQNWWNKAHEKICQTAFDGAIFTLCVSICSLLGSGGQITTAVVGTLVGGRTVVDALRALSAKKHVKRSGG
jgi:hypothetical protein